MFCFWSATCLIEVQEARPTVTFEQLVPLASAQFSSSPLLFYDEGAVFASDLLVWSFPLSCILYEWDSTHGTHACPQGDDVHPGRLRLAPIAWIEQRNAVKAA